MSLKRKNQPPVEETINKKQNVLSKNKKEPLFTINETMKGLINFIDIYDINKNIKHQTEFIIQNSYDLINEVYNNHSLIFDLELKQFLIITNCLHNVFIKQKSYKVLVEFNEKLFNIYNRMNKNILKFECYYNIIHLNLTMGNLEVCKEMLKNFNKHVKLKDVSIRYDNELQTLKNKIYKIDM